MQKLYTIFPELLKLSFIHFAIQTVQGCFSAVGRLGYRRWASNAEPTYNNWNTDDVPYRQPDWHSGLFARKEKLPCTV